MIACNQCGKPTPNKKFCSRTCSNSHTNRQKPKRVARMKLCPICGTTFKGRNKVCNSACGKPADMTLQAAIYTMHHKSSAFALVRSRSRLLGMKLNMTACEICGYSRHVEISHIRPISDFPLDTLLSVINSPDNLRPLCPNHHWEMDHPKKPTALSS